MFAIFYIFLASLKDAEVNLSLEGDNNKLNIKYFQTSLNFIV